MPDPLLPHIERLRQCAQDHLVGDETKDHMIQLKLDHSMRVLDNAERIIEGEGITGHTAYLTRLAALYHDIGRFPQLARYGTFKDRDSINHARLGVLTLREIDLPDDVSEKDWRIIRFAIAQHNAKQLRTPLPSHLEIPTKVVRDADKLDIYHVMVDHLSKDGPHRSTVIQGVKDDPVKFSDTIYDSVMAGQDGDYGDMRFINDFILLIIGWVFNLYHATSSTLLDQRGHIDKLFGLLPDDQRIEIFRKKIDGWMHYNIPPVS